MLRSRALIALLLFTHAPALSAQGDETVVVPFELNAGKIYVRASVNGSRPLDLVLDAGSPRMILDSALKDELQLETGPAWNTQSAGEGVFRMAPVLGELSVELCGVELTALGGSVGTIDQVVGPYEGRRIDGVLGVLSIFVKFVIEVDYQEQVLRLHPTRTYVPPTGAIVLPMSAHDGRMMVLAKMFPQNGELLRGVLLIDTGMRGSVLLHTPFVQQHELLDRSGSRIHRTVGGGVGGRAEYDVARLRALQLGDVVVEDVPVWLSSAESGYTANDKWAGILGSRFLQRYRVAFDYVGERLVLEPTQADLDRLDADKSGIFLVADVEDRSVHRVLEIVPGSPAAKAGLRVGDVVRSVDGEDGQTLEAVRRLLRSSAGTTVRLSVERGGKTIETKLVLRRLV